MAAQGHPFCESLKVSLANVYIIKERVGRIAGIVVVVTGQGQRIGMARRHTGRYLNPRGVIVAGLRQNRRSRSCRVILERGCRPVIRHRVRAMHLIPEGQRTSPAGYREGLADATIAIGRRRSTRLTGVAPTVRRAADGSRAARRPAGERSRLKARIDHWICNRA